MAEIREAQFVVGKWQIGILSNGSLKFHGSLVVLLFCEQSFTHDEVIFRECIPSFGELGPRSTFQVCAAPHIRREIKG
jgi:hypothetical protein